MTGDVLTGAPTVVRVVERSYDVTAGLSVPDLLGAGAPDPSPPKKTINETVLDTADRRLLAAGAVLRWRDDGPDPGWYLEIPSGTELFAASDARDEVRIPALSGPDPAVPAAVTELVRVYTRGAALEPVAELATRRRRFTDGDAEQARYELWDDRIRAYTRWPVEIADRRRLTVRLCGEGTVEDLDAVERRLPAGAHRRTGSATELARWLDRLFAAPGPGPNVSSGKAARAGDAVLESVRAQVAWMRRHDPLVRLEAPKAVSEMRVATRRLRSTLGGYKRILDRRGTREVTDGLKWLGEELAEARDTEMMAKRFRKILGVLPDELILGPVEKDLKAALVGQYEEGERAFSDALDSDRYLALQECLDRLLADPPLTDRAGRRARTQISRSVARAYRRLEKRLRAAEVPDQKERDTALHEARKAAKRVRYMCEVAVPVIGRPADRLRRQTEKLQKVLGKHQDAVVARPVLHDVGVHVDTQGHNAFTYGVLYAEEYFRAATVERKLPRHLARLRAPENVSWLG